MNKRLFVGGLPYTVNDQELGDLFSKYGSVVSAKVIVDKQTNRSKGFGFVEFENEEDAEKAIKEMNDSEVGGRKITVNEARPPREDR
jgi:cold-inducible RNA-binding protein